MKILVSGSAYSFIQGLKFPFVCGCEVLIEQEPEVKESPDLSADKDSAEDGGASESNTEYQEGDL